MPFSSSPTPVVSPSDWRGADLRDRPDLWLHRFTAAEIAELEAAVVRIKAAGTPPAAIAAADAPLTVLKPVIADWLDRLERGLGFFLARGLPVRAWSKADSAIAYRILGAHMGQAVSQNTAGETLVDIRDTGAPAGDHNTRQYKTRSELSFHTDGADLIGLMCLRSGRSGGVSRICSSVHVYNEVVRRRPDLAPLLLEPWRHHAHGQGGPGGAPTFSQPIVSLRDGRFRMFLLIWYIRNAAADFPEIAALSDAQVELLDLLERIPLEPGVALDMDFQPGDLQFLKNSVILHARTEYQDWDEPEEKRHLLRLWLTDRRFADGDESLRRGVAAQSTATV